MEVNNIFSVSGTRFPAGRLTRVLVGPGAPAEAEGFVLGHVTVEPGGAIPLHAHQQEEVYLILSGRGRIEIDGEIRDLKAGDYVYINPNASHHLENASKEEELTLIFCYSPKGIVDHWQEELEGKLK